MTLAHNKSMRKPTSPHSIVEAAGLLLVTYAGNNKSRPDQFLLMRHRNRWDLPKGHCETGESLIETALRETDEETGIPADNVSLIAGFSFSLEYPVTYASPKVITFTKRVTYFLGSITAARAVRCTEHEGYQWFKWSPPHRIQVETIDPLLEAAAAFYERERFLL